MNEKSVKKFLLCSSIIVVFLAVLVNELEYFNVFSFFKRKHFLIIGILSAPENFEQRISIRKTWLQLLSEISATVYFIIGKICEIPPYDRADPYSCVDRPFALPENATDLTEFSTIKIQNTDSKRESFIGFGFGVRNSIKITKLGILSEVLMLLNKEIQVKLISSFDNKVLASVTFNSELLSECNLTVVTKAIKPVRVDGSFEGILKLDIKDVDNVFFSECSFALWENKPYVINFIELWKEGSVMPQPFDENSCTYVFMSYTVVDTDNIKLHTNNRTLRQKEWLSRTQDISLSLQNESVMYDDISLVDVIDVYRNLSMKLVDFYKRIVDAEEFSYVLKTDDDSFVDVLRVYEHLEQVNEKSNKTLSKFWLWSYFKQFWRVEHSGKWRENQYQSASYPTFPCGGGYVLNKRVANFITNNPLHHFQGEDVSLGIWLSAFPVTYYKTPKVVTRNSFKAQESIVLKFSGERSWESFKKVGKRASDLCEWTCDNLKYFNVPLCNKVQLSVSEMYAVWEEYVKQGFLT